jgi:hypothetical protein
MMTDYTNINEMPEWAKQMACDKANARVGMVVCDTNDIPHDPTLTELALMCWQFDEEPVDPDLLIAREAMAQACKDEPQRAAAYRAGNRDNVIKETAVYIAARLAREQGSK